MHNRKLLLKARSLRSLGASLGKIAKRLEISKSTASLWLRDSKLTDQQRRSLLKRPNAGSGSRELALKRTERWQLEAVTFWQKHKNEALFLLGIGLYWGEGSRTQKCLGISNNDPGLLRVWTSWCKCYLPRGVKQTVRILAHGDVNASRARRYWARATGYPVAKHVTRLPTRGTKKPKKLAPYGTAVVRLGKGSAEWCTKMLVWIQRTQMEF